MGYIPKDQLIVGAYYLGQCRNASVARWDGTVFTYWRTKFGYPYLEEILTPDDDTSFDVFYPETLLTETPEKEIPLNAN